MNIAFGNMRQLSKKIYVRALCITVGLSEPLLMVKNKRRKETEGGGSGWGRGREDRRDESGRGGARGQEK